LSRNLIANTPYHLIPDRGIVVLPNRGLLISNQPSVCLSFFTDYSVYLLWQTMLGMVSGISDGKLLRCITISL
jgi:hypothetical protein